MRRARGMIAAAVAVGALLAPATALACPVCFGEATGPMAEALNNGVLFMLGVVAVVQFGFVGLFVAIWRRNKQYRERKESMKVINGGRS